MKVIKEPDQGILLNYFSVDNRYYLAVTVMTFFDFRDPDQPLSEQELWPFVQKELGTDTILDSGMPKPQGELLVHGYAFAPAEKPVPALPVEVRVGPVAKQLNVFGDRFWKRAGDSVTIISDPVPFTVMPLSWSRSFGGAEFAHNPLGKGIASIHNERGEQLVPLPNIEHPQRLIAAPHDRPEPAGFAPLDSAWPQRAKKTGTYDQNWLAHRWPSFPEDMDWTFFNAAQDDQQRLDFFAGGEKLALKHLHKHKPLIESRLPALRQRCFINCLADPHKPRGETLFKEVPTRLETIWLFPHAERGIALFRGAVEVADDEALDVQQLYLVTEALAEQPKTIEQHHEQFIKRLNRKIPEAAAAAAAQAKAEAQAKLAAVAERLKDLPLEISDAMDRGMGLAPSPGRTTAQLVERAQTSAVQKIQLLDDAEKRLQTLKGKFGHLVKVDLSGIARGRERLTALSAELALLPGMASAAHADLDQGLQGVKAKVQGMQGKLSAEHLAKHHLDDPDRFIEQFKQPKPDPWQEQGMRFVEKCRDNLEQYPQIMKMLTAMGLRRYTIKRFWIGINPTTEVHDPASWGLPERDPDRESPCELTLPAGIVVPCFDKALLRRIRIRSLQQHTYPPPDFPKLSFSEGLQLSRDVVVEGSGDTALVIGAGQGKACIRVAHEFEAVLLHQEIGDLCAVAALSEPGVKPDKETAALMKQAPQFLVLLYPGATDPANREISLWQAQYPQAEPLTLPAGKNLHEAKRGGADIWQWIADALRPDLAPSPDKKPKEADISKPGAVASLVPVIDVTAMITKVRDGIMAKVQPDIDLVETKKKVVLDTARKQLAAQGHDLDQLMKTPVKSLMDEANPFKAAQEKNAGQLAALRQSMAQKGPLSSQLSAKLAEADRINNEVLSKAASQYESGLARLEAAKAQAAAGLPGWAKKLFAKVGFDPDDPKAIKPLTRDEVVTCHGQGRSLAGKNLSGLDLSGLDLSGVDLRKAKLIKTNLKGCCLDGADLSRAIANESDFSDASLQKARLGRGIFQKAIFTKAKLAGSDFSQAILKEADFSGADLRDALLEKALLEKALLKGANLAGASAAQANFIGTDATEACFSRADLTKTIFLKARLDGADLSGATAQKLIFLETKGDKVNFSSANLFNARIYNDSSFTNGDFRDTRAQNASWMKSDLSGSDFRGMEIRRGLVQECNLAGANLSGVAAREARFTKSDLSNANCKELKLFQGSLRKSKLGRTDLSKANLYGVEFFRTGVGETRFDGANLKMTKLHNRTDLLPGLKPDKH
jgi:uncharacterized protein YjbI with pentapeptide repeats